MKRIFSGTGLLLLLCGLVFAGGSLAASDPAAGQTAVESAGDQQDIKVEIFGTSWCPYCRKATKFFQDRGLTIVEYDIERDHQAAAVKNRLDRQRGVPFILINRKYAIHGYSPEGYEMILKKIREGESS